MKIEKLKIKNFKNFREKVFEFNEQFTVLIGENGSGKTSSLDALAVATGAFLEGIDGVSKRFIDKDEVCRESFGRQSFEFQIPVEIEAWSTISGKGYHWVRTKKSVDGRTRGNTKGIKNLAAKYQELVRSGDKSQILPVFVYHGTGRLWAEHKSKVEFKSVGSRLDGYIDCLSPKSSSKQFLSWYKTYFDSKQKFAQEEDKAAIQAFNNALTALVKEWQEIAFDFVENDLVGTYTSQDGTLHFLPYRMLSDGYRNVIGMAADIAYRCIKLNPHLGINAVTETPGIVLIDELDLHLHPNWQKNIVADLKRVFPAIQFVATTHSLFIVQSLKATELISLDEETPFQEDPFREGIEDVAENFMNVEDVERSNEFLEREKVAAEYFDLIAKGQNEATNGKVKELKERLDELELRFSDDPAYVALMKAERASQPIKI